MIKKRFLFVVLIGLFMISVVGCSSGDENGTIAATVNGVEISMDTFDDLVARIQAGYEMQGFSFDGEQGAANLEHIRQEAIESLVQQEAVVQEAKSLGYEISQEEIDQEYNLIKDEFTSEEEFFEALELSNFTEAQFKDMLAEDLLLAKFIENEVVEVDVTDEEIKEVYEDYVADIEGYNEGVEDEEEKLEIPSYEELEDDIREFVKDQNQHQQVSALVESIVGKSEIEIFV